MIRITGPVAQRLERRPVTADAAGSIPVGAATPQQAIRPPRLIEIYEACARAFEIPPAALLGRLRSRRFAWPRMLAMLIAHRLRPDLSLTDIARPAGRDHTTVLHAIRTMRSRIAERHDLRERLDQIEAGLRGAGWNPWEGLTPEQAYRAGEKAAVRGMERR